MKKLTIDQRDEILVHMPLEWEDDIFYNWLDENTEEDWAGINPNYDPYADAVLGRVDKYFEDDQGVVDTVIVK